MTRSTVSIYDKNFDLLYSGDGDADTPFELQVVVDPLDGPRLVGRVESVVWSKWDKP